MLLLNQFVKYCTCCVINSWMYLQSYKQIKICCRCEYSLIKPVLLSWSFSASVRFLLSKSVIKILRYQKALFGDRFKTWKIILCFTRCSMNIDLAKMIKFLNRGSWNVVFIKFSSTVEALQKLKDVTVNFRRFGFCYRFFFSP